MLFPSESPPDEEVRGTAAETGVSSSRVCKEGGRKVLLAAAATAAADRVESPSQSSSFSSSLTADKFSPPIAAVVKDRSSSLMMCKTRLTILPTASSALIYHLINQKSEENINHKQRRKLIIFNFGKRIWKKVLGRIEKPQKGKK